MKTFLSLVLAFAFAPLSAPELGPAVEPEPVGAADYTLSVSGSCVWDWGCDAQEAVDSNPLSFVDYGGGFAEVAGHNFGPAGVIALFEPGDVVRVRGAGEGVYVVESTRRVAQDTLVDEVPQGFAFQTCVGSQMVLAYARRVA